MNLLDMITPNEVPVKQEKPKKEEKSKASKEVKTNKVEKDQGSLNPSLKKFKYPFEIYLAAEKRDVSHIFLEEREYSDKEITKMMLEHGFFEFSGNVTYDFMEKENILVPVFQQHKKG